MYSASSGSVVTLVSREMHRVVIAPLLSLGEFVNILHQFVWKHLKEFTGKVI
jgi:hypothetical protein